MNKKRNIGLVYEFLVRRLGTQLVEQDGSAARRTVEITERYFGPRGSLSEELELFRVVRDARGMGRDSAKRVLDEVSKAARKVDVRRLESKKGALIGELNRAFGRDFFDRHRIPDYRFFGAVQLFLDGRRSGRLSETADSIRIEEALVGWMTARPRPLSEPGDRRIDGLVCAMAKKKFDEKYGDSLSVGQKRLLETYVSSLVTEDKAQLLRRLREDRDSIAQVLVSSYRMDEVQGDPVMKGRYVEAAKMLSESDIGRADESAVEEMMLFHRLSEELRSDG